MKGTNILKRSREEFVIFFGLPWNIDYSEVNTIFTTYLKSSGPTKQERLGEQEPGTIN